MMKIIIWVVVVLVLALWGRPCLQGRPPPTARFERVFFRPTSPVTT